MITRRMMLAGLTAASLVGMLMPAGAHGTEVSIDYGCGVGLVGGTCTGWASPSPFGEGHLCCGVRFDVRTAELQITADDDLMGPEIPIQIEYYETGAELYDEIANEWACTPTATLQLPEGAASIVVWPGIDLAGRAPSCGTISTTGTLTVHWM